MKTEIGIIYDPGLCSFSSTLCFIVGECGRAAASLFMILAFGL